MKGNPLIDQQLHPGSREWKGRVKNNLTYRGNGEVRQIAFGPETKSGRTFVVEGTLSLGSLPETGFGLAGALIVDGLDNANLSPQCGKVLIPMCDFSHGEMWCRDRGIHP